MGCSASGLEITMLISYKHANSSSVSIKFQDFFFLNSWATSRFAKKKKLLNLNLFVGGDERLHCLSVCPSFQSPVDLTLEFHLSGTHVLTPQSNQSQGLRFSALSFSNSTHTTRLVRLFLCCKRGRNSLSRIWSSSFRCTFHQRPRALPTVCDSWRPC